MACVAQADVNFLKPSDGGLCVEIRTEHLLMRSVREDDCDYYEGLYGNPEVMKKYAAGETKDRDYVIGRIAGWVKRWLEDDPFAGMAVFSRDTGTFIGHVVLGYGDNPGESEIAFLFHKTFWGQGYGKEAVTALVNDYSPALISRDYKLEGKPLTRIIATTRSDNPASVKILEGLGMRVFKEERKFGALRNHYAIQVADLPPYGDTEQVMHRSRG